MEVDPSYEQKAIPPESKRGKLCLIASPDGSGDSVKIHADAKMYVGLFNGDEFAKLELKPGRKAYVHLIRGEINVNAQILQNGDALLIEDESSLTINAGRNAEVLVFDLSN
jgi:redox-sensitive bicupin YhaK (pirin superfamily)